MRKALKILIMTSAFAAHGACDDVIWLLSGAPEEEESVASHEVDAPTPVRDAVG